jgi:hypothetical protein
MRHSSLGFSIFRTCEAKTLARDHIAWLDQTYPRKKDQPDSVSLIRLKKMIRKWTPCLNAADLQESMSTSDMAILLRQLSQVFFDSVIPLDDTEYHSVFEWMPASKTQTWGDTAADGLLLRIRLHPTLRRTAMYSGGNALMYQRLATLLHELGYAFFYTYACRQCPDWSIQIGTDGHGEAWQALTKKIEQVASQLLAFAFDMNRVFGLMNDQDRYQRLVEEKKDWKAFGFDDAPFGRAIFRSPEKFPPSVVDRCLVMKYGNGRWSAY